MTKEQFEEMLDLVLENPAVIESAFRKFKPVVAKFIGEFVADYKEEVTKFIRGLVSDEVKKIIRDINPFK